LSPSTYTHIYTLLNFLSKCTQLDRGPAVIRMSVYDCDSRYLYRGPVVLEAAAGLLVFSGNGL
jgi:hypothetical protein